MKLLTQKRFWLIVGSLAVVALVAIPHVAHAFNVQDALLGKQQAPDNIDKADIRDVLVRLIRYGLAFAAAIGALSIVVTGYQYVLAAGNPEKLEKAKMGLTWSVGGFILVTSAYAIVVLTQDALQQKSGTRVNAFLHNPPGFDTAEGILPALANIIFAFAGTAAIIFLILGGYRYATSQANPELAEKAKKTIIYSIIGLMVVFASVLIFDVVRQTLR